MRQIDFIAVLIVGVLPQCRSATTGSYKAAVYSHAIILPPVYNVSRQEALGYVQKNLDIYETQTRFASSNGSQIIVFPEDGLYGWKLLRDYLLPYLEEIGTPGKWNPCRRPLPENIAIQGFLSCLAKDHSMYIVANMGEVVYCQGTKSCPPDGRYQFNTDVVFDPQGNLVAKYHKEELFLFEYLIFNQPPETEFATFSTPFGKFGVFTCFDVLFKNPAVTLVDKYSITDVVFPTAWMNVLPLFSAVQFHSAWASGMGVNFLAANIQIPSKRMIGSGIYTPTGYAAYWYNKSPEGKLLIADIPINHRTKRYNKQKITDVSGNDTVPFQSDLFGDTFNFVVIDQSKGNVTVCHNELCCLLEYKTLINETELYALGAFDGLHTLEGKYYLQICVLLKCANNSHSSCGASVSSANTKFSYIRMSGTHQTRYVFPEVLTDNNRLVSADQWQYTDAVLSGTINDPLLSSTLFGRVYDRDPPTGRPPPTKPFNHSNNILSTFLHYVSTLLIMMFSN